MNRLSLVGCSRIQKNEKSEKFLLKQSIEKKKNNKEFELITSRGGQIYLTGFLLETVYESGSHL